MKMQAGILSRPADSCVQKAHASDSRTTTPDTRSEPVLGPRGTFSHRFELPHPFTPTEAPMSRHQYECPGCGEPVPSIWGSIVHCDPNEPIDDVDAD